MSDHHHVWVTPVYEVRCEKCRKRVQFDDKDVARDVARTHRCGDTDAS